MGNFPFAGSAPGICCLSFCPHFLCRISVCFFVLRFVFPAVSASLENCINLLLQALLIIFPAAALLIFPVGNIKRNIHLKPLVKDFFQIVQNFFPSSFGYNGIQQLQADNPAVSQMNLRMGKHTGRQHTCLFQLQYHTVPVFPKQDVRRILSGKCVLFHNFHIDMCS